MNRCILVEVRIQYVPYYLSGTCTVPLLAYHPRLPNLCSQRPDDTPALHFFDSVLAQSSLFLYFFRSVPLITGLPPVGGFLLNLEHLNVRPFIVSWGLRGIYSQLVFLNYYGFCWLLTFANSWTMRSPLVRWMSFGLILRNLHGYPFGVPGALQWRGYLPGWPCLISRSCSSVQTFAVWLTSVLGSPQTTLPPANTSRHNPCV